ncbi:uncharacterized protein C8Q71DRAFT_702186 [Rhodofomes roseus]|uniref:VWFA domain-containing protein n=1 Tax=Rhodofomes roseus TaxID=34475 RepID=A0ABQ8KR81_9APHY|nr:uncharacterized protein C8Q71DRAFT_702186 [Rhodofomes roseus]KAH9841132.1 hypothetical protein C8Q71DRAFT_702186 [Rhodofomes roseus]
MDQSTSFSSAATNASGHAVSVLILVEDSQTMLAKWDDVRHRYLPALLHGLRADNKTSPQFRIWWFTSSPTFTPLTTTVTTLADYNNLPNLNLGRQTDTLISTGTIRRCVNVYLASGKQRRTNQHLIIIAASPLLTGSEGPGPVQAGIDPWVGTALALCQEEIHLHLIVGPANESRSFREMFSRTRFAQTLSEIPPWFEIDATRFSILISGRALQQSQQGGFRSSWQPLSPPSGSSGPVPLSDSTAAALRSLEAMAPRLSEFHTLEGPLASARSPTGRDTGRGTQLMRALAHRDATSADLSIQDMQALSSADAQGMAVADSSQQPSTLDRNVSLDQLSYYTMMSSASQASSPLPSPSLTAPESSAENVEDQPFIVTPEYEAFVAARFDEAVRSGAMQASMAANLSGTLSAPAVLMTGDVMSQAQEMQPPMYAGQQLGTQGAGQQTGIPYDSFAYSTAPAEIGGQWNPDHGYFQDPSLYGGPSAGEWQAR